MWFCVRRIGLQPHDVALAFTVALFAWVQRGWERESEHNSLPSGSGRSRVRWADFVRDQHQLLGCFVRGRQARRSERILAVAITSLALLYWKAILRPPPVKFASLDGLRHSLTFLFASKAVQFLMRRAIRFAAGRTAAWQAEAGWKEVLALQYWLVQYWVFGFMALCVLLFAREGWSWYSLLMGWLVNMAFALVVMDLAFCYIRYTLLNGFKDIKSRLGIK